MSFKASTGRIVLTLVLAAGAHAAAHAQFGGLPGLANLPEDDFTWRWGEERGLDDISIRAIDTGFNCTLTAALRPGSRLSRAELRRIENELRSSMSFIVNATNTMNALERQRDLEWAVLDCEKPEPDEDE